MPDLDSVQTWLRATLGTAVPEIFKLEVRAFAQAQKRRGIGRRAFLQSMTAAAGGLAIDPEQLIWTPTKRKNIILPVAAPETGVAVATHHGTRYYMLIDARGGRLHLFFDSGWRLLHSVEQDASGGGGSFRIAVPLLTPEHAVKIMALTGKTPIELGQMACQKHHGIYDEYTVTETEFGGGVVDRRLVRRVEPGFTVTEVAERIPYTQKLVSADNPADPWVEVAPQQFRDLTPEETVRLVHDAAQQTRIPRHRGFGYRRSVGVRRS